MVGNVFTAFCTDGNSRFEKPINPFTYQLLPKMLREQIKKELREELLIELRRELHVFLEDMRKQILEEIRLQVFEETISRQLRTTDYSGRNELNESTIRNIEDEWFITSPNNLKDN